MDDPMIIQEKVNLLHGFFSTVPEPMIIDVLNRPDINGNVDLASVALSEFMEFNDGENVINYVEYEPDSLAAVSQESVYYSQEKSEMSNEEEDDEEDDELDSIREKAMKQEVQPLELAEKSSELEVCTERESFQQAESLESFVTEKQTVDRLSRKEIENSNSFESEETFPVRCSPSNIQQNAAVPSITKVVSDSSGSKLGSPSDSDDSDSDVEKYFRSNYGSNEDRQNEAKATRNDSMPFDYQVDSQGRSVVEPVTYPKSCEQRILIQSVKATDRASKRDTSSRKSIPVCFQEEKKEREPTRVTPPSPKQVLLPSVPNQKASRESPRKQTPESAACRQTNQCQDKSSVTMEKNKTRGKPKPKRRSRGKRRHASQETEKRGAEESEPSFPLEKDQMRTAGDQSAFKPTKSTCEAKGILVTGLSEKTTQDALSNYMELMTGQDVENVKFLGQGRAVVDTSEPSDFEKVVKKVSNRMLDGMKLSVERIKVCDSVLISGLPPKATKDAVLLYFENVRRSGGGDVKNVDLREEGNCAVVCFEDFQVIDNVLSKEHTLEGRQLKLQKYYPQISSENSPNISANPTPSLRQSTADSVKLERSTNCPPSSERQNIECEVDVDIMMFIMSGKHRQQLEEKLNECKAEIEWNPGSNTAKIWKKANSGYVKKWSNSCQTVVCEFLDRFEKRPIHLSALVAQAIKNNLPRLTEKLQKGKALCKLHDAEKELVVVCLEEDKEAVSGSLKEILQVIEKEEIRKTYKKETVKDISYERTVLLEQLGFVDEMKSKYGELEVTLDKGKRELYFEGPRDQFRDSKIRYFQLMHAIEEQTFALSSVIFGNLVKKEAGKNYFRTKLAREKINAIFFPEEGSAVKIVAANSSALQKARDCLYESMKQDNVSFQPEDAFIFKSDKCKKLFKDLQEGELLNICEAKLGNSVALYGMMEYVENAKKMIQDLMDVERIRKQDCQISSGLMRFLDEQFRQKLADIESKLKNGHVSVQLNQTTGVLAMSGTQDGLKKCNTYLKDLLTTVVEESKEYSSPGLAKLLLGDKGQRNVKVIEIEKKVVIEMKKKVKDGVRNTMQTEVDRIEREQNWLMEERKARDNSQDFSSTGCIYDLCNFTTPEGLKVSWKHGCIESEVADILVNSATSNLTKLTACGQALRSIGGRRFLAACEPYTNVPEGDIVSTDGGSLSCAYVIHAVCCHWDRGKGAAEQLLRNIVKKILRKCIELRANSLAIPTIGTGQHRFPEALVFKVLKEEIENFSAANGFQSSLKEIRVIVYNPSQKTTAKPVASSSRLVSFGCVRVFLHEGDVTQQPTSVDAIINVLPSSLKLSSGGGVCKSILQAGGPGIQQQLNGLGSKPPGSVFSTDAGTMTNTKHIFHFIPMSTNVPGLQSAMEKSFNEAKLWSFGSVSTPAIGTASFGLTARNSAELILNAAKNFSIANYKLDVHIVVFQRNMIPDFETVLQEQANVNTPPMRVAQPVQIPSVSSLTSKTRAEPKKRVPSMSNVKSLKTGAAKEIVELHLFASSQLDADASLDEIDKFVEEHIVTKKVEHEKVFDVLVKQWPKIESLARDHDVSISYNKASSVIDIEGLVSNVSDCKDELLQLVTSYVEDERKSSQVEFISKNVQWYYFQGNQSVPYGKEINVVIETAYMESSGVCEIVRNGQKYAVDVNAKTETDGRSGHVGTITRKLAGDSNSEIAVPLSWSHQPSTQVVQLVSLQTSSPEYQQVLNHFTTRGGVSNQIIKIERIQNPGLYKAYLVKKQSMNGAENELQLFHGTRENNIVSINANNFNRSYAGINGVAFGNGVYFARDASYSLRYSQAGSSGYRTMYVAKVLVGQYTSGQHGMKAPPSRNDPNNPGLLFDSVVDNTSNPSIYVIFLDHQCYPEYLITFR